jgi:drug/metabolite transporter (DMT)-like permease
MEVVLALAAALMFAIGSVLLQKAGMDEPEGGSSSGLLLRLARRPVWLAGIAADALGYIGQAAALAVGRMAVVQPLLATAMVFALPLGVKITGQRVRGPDIAAAVLVTGALIVFLLLADPSGGRDNAPLRDWLIAGAVIAGVCAALVLAALRLRPALKAAALGTAAGILFAVTAGLTKAVMDQLDDGIGEVFIHWHLYALVAIGYISMTINQLALGTGKLAPALATSLAFDPIASVVLATTLLQEDLHSTTAGWIGTLAALAAALAGMAILARQNPEAVAPKPGAATGGAGAPAPR